MNLPIGAIVGLICLLCGSAYADQQLEIIKAIYAGGDVQKDVTSILSKQVRNGQLQFNVENGPFGGDPFFGKVKTLTVLYRNADGDFSITANEGEKLTIPNSKALAIAPAKQVPAVQDETGTKQAGSGRLAPDGVFFLIERTKVTTDSGIAVFAQGTRVELVSDSALSVKVKVGDQEFEIDRSKLTNDLDIAENQQQADKQQMTAQQQAMQRKLAEQRQATEFAQAEAAKEDLAKKNAANANRLRGRVLQATDKGLLVECEQPEPVVSSAQSMGGGGGSYSHLDPNGKGRPEEVTGTFWVVGHPNQNSKADEDYIDVNAFEDGTYSYTAVTGAAKRIKQYRVVKAFE